MYEKQIAKDLELLKKINLVAVAYSHIEREWFSTEDAYKAEAEVIERANEVIEMIRKMGISVKGYPADQYFFTNILVDKPDLVINLVDTVRGKERLQPAVPGALELSKIPYTGAGMTGLVIGNNRHLFKQMLLAHDIPTPRYKFIKDLRYKIPDELGFPLIVKLNESGGSVGIDNSAVNETMDEAQEKVKCMLEDYGTPLIVEEFIEGPEITAVVFDDGPTRHIFVGEKVFGIKPDGKHEYTSLESYDYKKSYYYKIPHPKIIKKIQPLASRAFDALRYKDYAKFDIRLDRNYVPYFVDCNPNTAFGPDIGLPINEIANLYGITFFDILVSLLSKHAKEIEKEAVNVQKEKIA